MRVLQRATPTVTQGICYNGHLGGCVTLTPIADVDSGAVTSCFYDLDVLRLEFEHPTFHMRGEHSYRLRHRGGRKR